MSVERRREQNRLAQRRFRQRHQDNGNGNSISRRHSQVSSPSIEASPLSPPPPPIQPTEVLTPTSSSVDALPIASTTTNSSASSSSSSTRSSFHTTYSSSPLLDFFPLNDMNNLDGSAPALDSSMTTASMSRMLTTEQPFLHNSIHDLAPYSMQQSFMEKARGGPRGTEYHSFRSGVGGGGGGTAATAGGGGGGGGGDGGDGQGADTGWASSLHIAAQKGRDRIVRVLLQHSADCNVPDSEGRTPLVCATIGGHKDVVALLLAGGALLSCVDRFNRSAIHWAVVYRRDSLLKLLLSHSHSEEQTPTRTLTQTHTVIDGYDLNGQTPLHLAIDEDFEAGVRLLLQFGANMNLVARRSSVGP